MSLTTDDLRSALHEAADAPYDAAGVTRVQDVRQRVRRARRRRASLAGGLGSLAVAGVVAAVVLGGGAQPVTRPASPTPSPSSSPSVLPSVPQAVPPLPTTWGVRGVEGALTGSGADTPAKIVTWPRQATGLLLRCPGGEGSGAVEVVLQRAGRPAVSSTTACDAAQEWQVGDLPAGARAFRPGDQVRLQVRLDAPRPGAAFGAGVLVGRDEVDLSSLRTAPRGWTSAGAYAMADGWQYSAHGPGETTKGTLITGGVQIALAGQSTVRLRVRCWSGVRLEVDPGSAGEATSVTCPAGGRSTTSLDVDLRRSKDQRLTLRALDAAPGAIVEVGVSTR